MEIMKKKNERKYGTIVDYFVYHFRMISKFCRHKFGVGGHMNKDRNPKEYADQTKIYEAIFNILELAIYLKMDQDEELPDCKDDDLRDWPQMNDDFLMNLRRI